MSKRPPTKQPRRGRPPKSLGLPPTRERILSAADDLFYRRGINRTGVDDVARGAGVSKASLYAEFGSKEGLAAAYLDRRTAMWDEWFAAQMREAPQDPRQRLFFVFDVLGRFTSAPAFCGCAFIRAAVETRQSRGGAHERAVRQKRATTDALRGLANDAGAHDPDALAVQLAVLIDGALVRAAMTPEDRPVEAAKRAAEALLRASSPG